MSCIIVKGTRMIIEINGNINICSSPNLPRFAILRVSCAQCNDGGLEFAVRGIVSGFR